MGGLISTFSENVENRAELLTVGPFLFFFFWHHKNSLEFWPQHIFHGIQARGYFLLNTGKEKITGCSPTASGLMGLPLKCQLRSDMPAALMIYRNSSVCVSELSLWERLWCLWESDDSRAVLQPPKAAFLLWLSGSHHIGHSNYTSKGLCMRRTVNYSVFYQWVHRCISVDFVPNSGVMKIVDVVLCLVFMP